MSAATQRIPVLVTPEEKERIASMARQAGLSMGEYLRRAAAAFRPTEDEAVLAGMIEQMTRTAARAEAAIDEALAFVEASNARIAHMEQRTGPAKAA
ncbi:MAG: ribbon-helix-helix protein, CopG family [Pseudomonadota bacterium]|nr:ribbon-helix-helix protein, CopG family [Pseudomonadota bacterium]